MLISVTGEACYEVSVAREVKDAVKYNALPVYIVTVLCSYNLVQLIIDVKMIEWVNACVCT